MSNRCNSCEALMINGVYCHEAGCPDAWRDYTSECAECGCDDGNHWAYCPNHSEGQ